MWRPIWLHILVMLVVSISVGGASYAADQGSSSSTTTRNNQNRQKSVLPVQKRVTQIISDSLLSFCQSDDQCGSLPCVESQCLKQCTSDSDCETSSICGLYKEYPMKKSNSTGFDNQKYCFSDTLHNQINTLGIIHLDSIKTPATPTTDTVNSVLDVKGLPMILKDLYKKIGNLTDKINTLEGEIDYLVNEINSLNAKLNATGSTSGSTPASTSGSGSTSGTGGCFTCRMWVRMWNRKKKRIADLEIGDEVLSVDLRTGALCKGTVGRFFVHEDLTELLVLNGTLEVTPNHPFWSRGRWVEAQHLQLGDVVTWLGSDGNASETMSVVIESKDSVPLLEPVYHIELAESHLEAYFVEDFLVQD